MKDKDWRPRINSKPLYQIVKLLKEKEESFHWGMLQKLIDGELDSGTLSKQAGKIVATMETNHVNDLDDLIRICGIDIERHRITKHQIKTSQTPMKLKEEVGRDDSGKPIYEDQPVKVQAFHVKAVMEEKVPERGIEQAFDRFVERASEFAKPFDDIEPIEPREDSKFGEISIYDLHVGKYSWAPETGTSYDVETALGRFRRAFRYLGQKCIDAGCDEVIVPLGNDLMHVDNKDHATSNGTPQDVDGRWQYMITKLEKALTDEIEWLSDKVRVKILYVPGNHDEVYSYFMTKYLKAWFRNNPNVEADDSPSLTKVYENGVNMLVFNHLKDIKPEALSQLIFTRYPQISARCWNKEVHGGHTHGRKKKGVTVSTFEEEEHGVIYRVLPSLSEEDAWHKRHGHEGNIKCAQALIYGKQTGFSDMAQYNELPMQFSTN